MVKGSDDSKREAGRHTRMAREIRRPESWETCGLDVPGLCYPHPVFPAHLAAGPDELELESVSSQMMEVVRTERLILLPVIKLVVQQGRCRELSLRNYGFERLLWSDLGA